MVLSTSIESPAVVVAVVTPTPTTGDQRRIIEWIRAVGAVRVVRRLKRFAGWMPTDAAE
jgi:hypothetical protein